MLNVVEEYMFFKDGRELQEKVQMTSCVFLQSLVEKTIIKDIKEFSIILLLYYLCLLFLSSIYIVASILCK